MSSSAPASSKRSKHAAAARWWGSERSSAAMTTSVSSTQAFKALAPLFGAQVIQVPALVEPVKDAKGGGKVRGRAVNDDPLGPRGLDHDLVSRPQPRGREGLDGQRHLMLGGDLRHSFPLT